MGVPGEGSLPEGGDIPHTVSVTYEGSQFYAQMKRDMYTDSL
jgi:hypothetical protein